MNIEIISESDDKVTNIVIEYLIGYKKPFRRINHEEFSNVNLLLDNNDNPKTQKKTWHRRAKRNLIPKEILNDKLTSYLKREEDPVNKTIEKIAFKRNNSDYIGGYYEEEQHNKIFDLFLAKEHGLKIPITLITTNKKELLEFKKNHGRIITKAIKYPFFFREKESYMSAGGTRLVDYKDIEDLNDYFFVSIFQEYVEKKYEIRVFFFGDKYYSMAIFSQNDEGTKIDFRNYNREKPNRCLPIKLPEIILSKLNNLMCDKNLNSGSIDIIVTPENDFVFLEVNPQGQFHWLSESCNYYVERAIANSL